MRCPNCGSRFVRFIGHFGIWKCDRCDYEWDAFEEVNLNPARPSIGWITPATKW